MKPWELCSDFGSGTTIDPRIAKQAAKTVAKRSVGIDDAVLLLDMLGLIPPQPGNEPTDLRTTKHKINLETRRLRKAQYKENLLNKLNATAEEIGEVE